MRFAEALRAQMATQKMSARRLGRHISSDDPDGGRRQIVEYLAGRVHPRRPRRRELAVGLGLPEDSFDEYEDEDDMLTALQMALAALSEKQRRRLVA